MGCNYYFVPKKLNYKEIDDLTQSYRDKLNELVSNYISNVNEKINNQLIDKEVSNIFNIHELSEDLCSTYIPTVDWPDVHICKVSLGWKPLLQSTKYYSSMDELIYFYEEYKDKIRVEDEYRQEIDFYTLIDVIKDRYKDNTNQSHINNKDYSISFSYYNYYKKDCEGYEWTSIDFS